MYRHIFLLLFVILLVLPEAKADDEWLIVPGKSVGKISLGMEAREVFRLLGAPHMQNDFEVSDRNAVYYGKGSPTGKVPVAEGVTQSDWVTPKPIPKESEDFMCDFVTVYVRDRTVVQIELRAPRFHTKDELSVRSSGKQWRAKFPGGETFHCNYSHPTAGGIPGHKHVVGFEDDVKAGIGWRCGVFGDLAPDVDEDGELETIIIHPPGERLLADPDGGSRFVWKDNPIGKKE